ncbi:MAG TPA: hypothetical protein ENJ56_00820, partial [Anaerolineae bacterium]|nr:hypothetical protein [Anaerolineae bacterium]
MAALRLDSKLERVMGRHFRPISFLTTALIAILITIFAGLFLGYTLLARSEFVFHGVTVAGQAVGSMPRDRVASQLAEQWQQQKVVFSADDLQVTLNPLDMGVRLDAAEAAQRAYAQGRHAKWWWLAPFQALKLNVEIAPRYIVDMGIADAYLTHLSDQFSIA